MTLDAHAEGGVAAEFDVETPTPVADRSEDELLIVERSHIHPDPNQPRRHFDQKALDELAASMKARGQVTPIEVRPHPQILGHYMIKNGERRWRASELIGLERLQVVVRKRENMQTVALDQLTANWHAQNMTPLEEADAIEREMERLRLAGHPNPREKVRVDLGISNSVLSKKLAVLKYPKQIRDLLDAGKIRDYQSVKNLSMLKSDDQAQMIKQVEEGVFNAKAFNHDPVRYLKDARRLAAENSGVPHEAPEPAPRRVANVPLARWAITKDILAVLIANTAFAGVMDGINIMDLNDEQARGVFERFKAWLLDPGESPEHADEA